MILGISAYYHDSAAVLLDGGKIIAAAHEERFTRIKHDASFPREAVRFVLEEGGVEIDDLESIAFYDKPWLKFERLLETYHSFAPLGLQSFLQAIPGWIKEKFFMKRNIWQELEKLHGAKIQNKPPLLFPEHHLSHAASAFYPSPYHDAAILTVDGVGEWATTTICHGQGKDITVLKELAFPHSLGLLYSAFTYYLGFKVNSGEYKLMGLAPYGRGNDPRVAEYRQKITDSLVSVKADGSILLNMNYFDFATGLTMCKNDRWQSLFGLTKRDSESELEQEHMDMALAIQQVTEEIVLKLARTACDVSGCSNLVLAGGVALNCVANGRLLKEGFTNVWIQPAAGDAGGALGAAYAAYHIHQQEERYVDKGERDSMQGCYLGPDFSQIDIRRLSIKYKAEFDEFPVFKDLSSKVATLLADGLIVGWCQGKMEWGPRALGNRSILGDPRRPEMQKKLNMHIKYREGFRPFAPSVLVEDMATYFDLQGDSPYMLLVAPVASDLCNVPPDGYDSMGLYERLYVERSQLPAITHVDFSARIQSVHKDSNPRYWQLINSFKQQTGCGLVVNTSFNVRGEPIVCTPEDAYRCFMRTEMDYLVIGDFLFCKKNQPAWQEKDDWAEEFTLD